MGLIQAVRLCGLTGTILITVAILISAVCYRGRRGERYSPLNHFISELGEVGVSPFAWVFNIGLTVGGLILLPFMIGLGAAFNSILGWLGAMAGTIATVSVAAVGLFPMNNLTPHVRAAMTYFRSGLALVSLIGLAILFQPADRQVLPHTANLLSLAAVLSYGSFLSLETRKRGTRQEDSLDPLSAPQRPRVWMMPLLEWIVFFSTVLWIFGIAAFV